uniref:DNA repair protein RecN n=1 Tax=Pararhizobium sp. IMCC3301 TaxID=3067904 RepID=UPI0027404B2F|nr:DNA repair protein RecN [Pararhizobium sp. IMCC3301]
MLANLTIRDIVLIDQLQISFEPGLTVLTGETGAGKSILLDSLSLALGARGDGGLVREGQEKGAVTASFDLPPTHHVFSLIRAHDLNSEGELILRRVQSADGRTRAFINDQPVSATLLREIGEQLIEIHGQHDDRALVDPATHLVLLDAFGGLEDNCADVAALFRQWRGKKEELSRLSQQVAEAAREADYLHASVEELSTLSPQEGEEEELAAKRQSMMQAEKVAGDINEAYEAVAGPQSPVPVIASLMRRLERKAAQAPGLLDEALAALDRALLALDESASALGIALRATEFDASVLENSEERLFALRAAARKFNVPVENLNALAVKMADEMDALDNSAERLAGLEHETAKAETAFVSAARAVSGQRQHAAIALEEAVASELPSLKLDHARFLVDFHSDEAQRSERGIDQAAFWVQTNPGTRPGPMWKVASGGELSRFLLALKVALADKGSAPCLIFDEIDTGVGGAVAEAIGHRLARLAERVQVLSVTHAPQVAARATGHLLIEKAGVSGQNRVETAVHSIGGTARKEEIARMLAGATITNEARAAAEKLIAGSSG